MEGFHLHPIIIHDLDYWELVLAIIRLYDEIVNINKWRMMREAKFKKLIRKAFLNQTDIFDKDFYLEKNVDVKNSKLDPIGHFLDYGIFEGREFKINFSKLESGNILSLKTLQKFKFYLGLFKFNDMLSKIQFDSNNKVQNKERSVNVIIIPNINTSLNYLFLKFLMILQKSIFIRIDFVISESTHGRKYVREFNSDFNFFIGENYFQLEDVILSAIDSKDSIIIDLQHINLDYSFFKYLELITSRPILSLLNFMIKVRSRLSSDGGLRFFFKIWNISFTKLRSIFFTQNSSYFQRLSKFEKLKIKYIGSNIFLISEINHINSFQIMRGSTSRYFSDFILETPFTFGKGAGGGEKYLLDLAIELTKFGKVSILNTFGVNTFQLHWLEKHLGLDLSSLIFIDKPNFICTDMSANIYIQQNNYLIPSKPINCVKFFYQCQFPFDNLDMTAESLNYYNKIDGLILTSLFVKNSYEKKILNFKFDPQPNVFLIPPKIEQIGPVDSLYADTETSHVTLLGRFSDKGHNKNQGLLIPLVKKFLGSNITFNLAGSVSPNDLDYLNNLKIDFKNLTVDFYPNIGRTELKQLLQKSQVFIHLTGLQVDPEINPEKCEHFGIAPLEAMSCGLVPFVVNNGGPSEYVHDGINGFLFDSIDELYMKLLTYFSLETDEKSLLKSRAIETAGLFNHQIFSLNIRDLVC